MEEQTAHPFLLRTARSCQHEEIAEIGPVGNAETTRAERLQNKLFDCLLTQELNDSMEESDDELSPEEEQEPASDPLAGQAICV